MPTPTSPTQPKARKKPAKVRPGARGTRVTKPPQQPGKEKPFSFNTERVKELSQQGLSGREIAPIVGTHHSNIHRFLQRVQPEILLANELAKEHPSMLENVKTKSLAAIDSLLNVMADDDFQERLKPSEMPHAAKSISLIYAILHDKHALLTGKSTQNIETVHKYYAVASTSKPREISSNHSNENVASRKMSPGRGPVVIPKEEAEQSSENIVQLAEPIEESGKRTERARVSLEQGVADE